MLFKELKDRKTKNPQFQFKVRISFTEIYKETVYDLLHQQREGQVSLESYPTVQVMEGEDGIILRNLSVYEITTKEDALKLFFLGNKNRITTATTMNNVSSRSHAIFTIAVDTEGRKGDRTVFTSGKINLVDLAGSERMYKMANTKEAITEAKSINLSLHYLEQVIVCLREQANQMIRAAAAAAAAAAVATAAASSAANNNNNAAAGAAGGLATTASTTSLSSHLGTDDPAGHNGSIKDIPRDPASARQSGASTVSATSLSVHSLNEAHPPPTNANTAATATTTAASNNSNKATSLARIPTANASRKDAKDHHKLSKDAGVDKDNAGIATTTNSSSNNNSNNVKDEPPSSSSSKSYFIPYRNSVLTSMLRDSLGGNCRSSFLLTISPCKLHFEETVATCRFGQRCGEVKVKVQANTEISLFDQLKDLQHKIKVQERRYLTLDEQRKQIERLLTAEQELRAIQTSIRALTPHEKIHCKTCVQELLAQAKDSLAIATQHVETNPDLFGHPPHGDPSALAHHHSQHPHLHHEPVFDHIEDAYDPPSSSLSTALVDANGDGIAEGTILPPLYADPAHNPPDPQQQHQRKQALIKDMANDLVEKTQDELYSQLETMDKAVLVELATALGGLVQSLFIDREMIKQEMLLQEMARQQALQDHYLREQLENQRRMVFRRAPIDELLRTLDTLPDTVIQALVYGTMFLKHSSSKGFLSAVQTKTVPRYVSVSPDLRYLLWRTIESHHSGGNGGIGSGGTTAGAHHVGGGLGGGGHGGGAGGNKLSSMLSAASNNTNTNAANNNNKDVNRRSLRAAFGLLERTNSTTAATSGAGAGGGGGGGGGNAAGNNHSSNTLLLPPPNPNNYVDETTTASGAEDVVSIPLTAFDSVEYHPVTRTIELRPKPGQTKPMLLEFLGQNHTVGCMAELFHQPQYQMTAPASSAGPTAASFTFLDFVLSAEEWVKALRYLIARSSASAPVSATASPQQHQQQMVYYGA
jgi:hypothetical protein